MGGRCSPVVVLCGAQGVRDALQRVDDGAGEVVRGVGLVLGAGAVVGGVVAPGCASGWEVCGGGGGESRWRGELSFGAGREEKRGARQNSGGWGVGGAHLYMTGSLMVPLTLAMSILALRQYFLAASSPRSSCSKRARLSAGEALRRRDSVRLMRSACIVSWSVLSM